MHPNAMCSYVPMILLRRYGINKLQKKKIMKAVEAVNVISWAQLN